MLERAPRYDHKSSGRTHCTFFAGEYHGTISNGIVDMPSTSGEYRWALPPYEPNPKVQAATAKKTEPRDNIRLINKSSFTLEWFNAYTEKKLESSIVDARLS